MSKSIALSPQEVQDVTGYKYPKKQIYALIEMDIPFKVRPNGTVFVARATLEQPQQTPQQQKTARAIVRDF